jgi:protein-tyrosine phosphatase
MISTRIAAGIAAGALALTGLTLAAAPARAPTERVELGCAGGVGRTGTALAVLAVLSGVPAVEAVGWVRRHYHRRAVETPWQRRWVVRAAGTLAG